MSLKKAAILFLAVCAATAIIPGAQGADSELVKQVSGCPAAFLRQQRDPRFVLHEEKLGKEHVVHILLTLSDQPQAYTFTLGWFTAGQDKKGAVLLNEHQQPAPLPGEKPRGLSKAEIKEFRGIDLLSDRKPEDALKEFADAVRDPQGSPQMYNNLGACQALLGQFENARKQLDLAIKMRPEYAVAVANKAWLEQATGRMDDSLADAESALRLDPELRTARFAAVKALIGLSRLKEALQVSEDTVKRWPSDPPSVMMSGDALASSGDYKSARARYQKALLIMPNDPRILLKIAEAAQAVGDLDDALKRARQATVVASDSPEAHLALGRYLEMNRDNRAAQLQFERALDLNPPPAMKLAIYGPALRVLTAIGKMEEADKLSAKWLAASPGEAECHYNRAWIASQLSGPKHAAEAVDEYRKAMALNNGLVQAHYNLALVLVKQGKLSEAASELKSFIKLSPQDPDVANAQKLLVQLGH